MNKISKLKMKPATRIAAALMLAGLVAAGVAGCDANGQTADATIPSAPAVSIATVIQKPITETQEFSGRLEAIERVEIRSRVSGFITAVNIQPGAEVKKGDVLFVIDPRPYQAEFSRTEAVAAAARAKAELARLELTRAETLLADKAIPQREYDEKASSLKELEANARAAQAEFSTAKLNLDYTRVHSPIDGRVGKAEITVGNLINSSAVLTSVVSTDRIYASFDGDEDTYLRVSANAHQDKPVIVKVGLANETGFPHEGRLEFVDNQLNAKTGSVRLRALFANRDKTLAPGLFARVQVSAGNGTDQLTQALLINDRAVGTDQSKKFVMVVGRDNKAMYRTVKLGPTVDGLRVVREGLKPGENVVVNGLQRVHSGDAVAPQLVAMDDDAIDAGTPPSDIKQSAADGALLVAAAKEKQP